MGIPHISIPRLGFNVVFKDPNLRFPTGAWRISGARSRLKEPFNCTPSAASTTTGLKPCSRQREALLRWRFKETKPGFRCQKFVRGTLHQKKIFEFWVVIFWGVLVLSCFVVWMSFWAGWVFSSYEQNCLQKKVHGLWDCDWFVEKTPSYFPSNPGCLTGILIFMVYEIIPA